MISAQMMLYASWKCKEYQAIFLVNFTVYFIKSSRKCSAVVAKNNVCNLRLLVCMPLKQE